MHCHFANHPAAGRLAHPPADRHPVQLHGPRFRPPRRSDDARPQGRRGRLRGDDLARQPGGDRARVRRVRAPERVEVIHCGVDTGALPSASTRRRSGRPLRDPVRRHAPRGQGPGASSSMPAASCATRGVDVTLPVHRRRPRRAALERPHRGRRAWPSRVDPAVALNRDARSSPSSARRTCSSPRASRPAAASARGSRSCSWRRWLRPAGRGERACPASRSSSPTARSGPARAAGRRRRARGRPPPARRRPRTCAPGWARRLARRVLRDFDVDRNAARLIARVRPAWSTRAPAGDGADRARPTRWRADPAGLLDRAGPPRLHLRRASRCSSSLRARLRPRARTGRPTSRRSVSVIIAAHNEAGVDRRPARQPARARLSGGAARDRDRLGRLDGRTVAIVAAYADRRVRAPRPAGGVGKADGLNGGRRRVDRRDPRVLRREQPCTRPTPSGRSSARSRIPRSAAWPATRSTCPAGRPGADDDAAGERSYWDFDRLLKLRRERRPAA